MPTPKKVGGYVFNQELYSAERACSVAREQVKRILEDQPGASVVAVRLARTAVALGEIQEALQKLKSIARGE